MMGTFELPDLVRDTAAALGGASAVWIDRLPGLVQSLERDWGLSAGETLTGGSAALVIAVTTEAGAPCVLKLLMPGPEDFTGEVRALQLADGRGYPKVLNFDPTRRALLLPQLGRKLGAVGGSVEHQMEIICATLKLGWVHVSDPAAMMSGADKAAWLSTAILDMWRAQGQPCSPAVMGIAETFAARRAAAFDPTTSVLVHGDAHADNLLEAAASPTDFLLVDPDGLFAERAYDLAIPMREWSEVLLAGEPLILGRERCGLLARMTGLDAAAIWEWGFLERLSTGLYCLKLGRPELAEPMLQVSEAWTAPFTP